MSVGMTEIVIVCHAHVAKVVRVERVASCVSVDRWEKEVPCDELAVSTDRHPPFCADSALSIFFRIFIE